MENLLIAISGCGGGTQGPQGIYQLFSKHCDYADILPFDTLPEDVQENAARISKIAQEHFDRSIILVGHSMGGAIAAQAAYALNQNGESPVKGLVLINTQPEGMQALKELNIPVLFYNGKNDEVFPSWQVESIYEGYKGRKRKVEIEGLDHDLTTRDKNALANDALAEIKGFFFEGSEEGVFSKNIAMGWKARLFSFLSLYF